MNNTAHQFAKTSRLRVAHELVLRCSHEFIYCVWFAEIIVIRLHSIHPSNNINWIRQFKEQYLAFWKEHVFVVAFCCCFRLMYVRRNFFSTAKHMHIVEHKYIFSLIAWFKVSKLLILFFVNTELRNFLYLVTTKSIIWCSIEISLFLLNSYQRNKCDYLPAYITKWSLSRMNEYPITPASDMHAFTRYEY